MTDKLLYWYQLDSATRDEIAQRYVGMPLDVLNLPLRARNALSRYTSIKDVSGLLAADESIATTRGLGAGMIAEVNELMMALVEGSLVIVMDGNAEESRALAAHANPPAFPLPHLVADLPLGVLHLPLRTYNVFMRYGMLTTGDLDLASMDELIGIPGVGKESVKRAKARIDALRQCLVDGDKIDWAAFWNSQHIDVVPASQRQVDSVKGLVDYLPIVIEQVFAREQDDRQWHILQRRYGLGGASKRTLDELGQAFSLTRERVRQVEEKALATLRHVLVDNNYTDKSYHIAADVLSPFAVLWNHLNMLVVPAILESDMRQSLLQTFGLSSKQIEPISSFLVALAEIERVPLRGSNSEWLLYKKPLPFTFDPEIVIPIINETLSQHAAPVGKVDILIEVNKKLAKPNRVRLDELHTVLFLCSTAEDMGDGVYRCRFEALHTRVDQAERILLEEGKPMKPAGICRVMNHRLALTGSRTVNEPNLTNQMSNDARFVPIGRSGEWALKSWELETSTIVSLMRHFLTVQNHPATIDEIAAFVQDRRPASKESIKAYLTLDKSFAKVDRWHWGLAEWAETRVARTWSMEQVGSFVEDFFKSRKTNSVDYSILKAAIVQETGMAPKQVRILLNINPVIKTKVIDREHRLAIFQPEYKDKLQARGKRTKRKQKTLLEQIGADVQLLLRHAPGQQLDLSELIALLTPKYGAGYKSPYHTIHGYVARLTFVERFTLPDSRVTKVRLVKAIEGDLPEKANLIRTQSLRSTVLRCLNFLDEQDIDVALFLLSKEFEATLKKYVQEGERLGRFANPVPTDTKLATLVSFVAKEQIVSDKAALDYLRQARNDRAHGAMPSGEERRIMMENIGVTAGMYLDYIKFFDDKTWELLMSD